MVDSEQQFRIVTALEQFLGLRSPRRPAYSKLRPSERVSIGNCPQTANFDYVGSLGEKAAQLGRGFELRDRIELLERAGEGVG